MSLFCGRERAKVNHFPIVLYVSGKPFSTAPDSFVSRCIGAVASHIRMVLACGSLSQVLNSVVKSVSVNMVDLFRQVPMNPQPHKPVGEFSLSINTDLVIPVISDAPSNSTGRSSRNANESDKNSLFSVIVEKATDFFVRHSVALKFSHGVSFQP